MTSDMLLNIISPGIFDFLESEDRRADLSSQKENAWSVALARYLVGCGFPVSPYVSCNKAYPGCSERFDVYGSIPGTLSVYLEVKGIWKSYWTDRGNLSKHEGYLFAPLRGRRSDKSAALDLMKLAKILPSLPDSPIAGQLILGSAKRTDGLGADLDLYEELSGINKLPWHKASRCWVNYAYPNFNYDARLYLCDSCGVADWWKEFSPLWH